MQTLIYNELNPNAIPNFEKIRQALERDDFRSAEVKKIGDNLYRARLDRSNRLLFAFYRYQNETYCLLLEWIEHHAYHKSRFLQRGVVIDEEKIPAVTSLAEVDPAALVYLNPKQQRFNLLDKILSFDEIQQEIYHLKPPLIIIGSAGSGKTALTLEKMKQASGEILYITRSSFLVQNSRALYFALGYQNEAQSLSFLSFDDYLASIQVPTGKELPFRTFMQWYSRHRVSSGLRDPYQLYEEFKGVITGTVEAAWLTREEYLALGVKQSIFAPDQREEVYDLFNKYRQFMQEGGFYDSNILSHHYLSLVEPRYDFVVIDEVQDLTLVQLQLILKSLHDPSHFMMSGDSNQIVHPNFFSWSKVKSLFYQQPSRSGAGELIRILNTNYRNSPEVTEVANRILKMKSARFGSVDRESNYLVQSNADQRGTVILLQQEPKLVQELNQKTRQSTRFAVVVMHPEQKSLARQQFDTPLIFSIQEAKGLEYENIILYNFISAEAERFSEITRGLEPADLEGEDLRYARAKDKHDKSLEIYKFHINSLYVALTRAVRNIYIIEQQSQQRLFELLELQVSTTGLDLSAYQSSLEEWRNEAHRLEMQGKEEQAEEIRTQILKLKKVPWEPLTLERSRQLYDEAVVKGNKKAKLLLFEYALVYRHNGYLNALAQADFKPAKNPTAGLTTLNQKYFALYGAKQAQGVMRLVDQYGVDFRNEFNLTPLMIATRMGNHQAVSELIAAGANPHLTNNARLNPFQIALQQAYSDEKYRKKQLLAIYCQLEPPHSTIQSGGRLYQIDNHLMEFLLLNLILAMADEQFSTRWGRHQGITSGLLAEALEPFPEEILPDRRKKQSYISSILSKNERHREGSGNRRLFMRVRHGHYLLNPDLSIRIGGEWVSVQEFQG